MGDSVLLVALQVPCCAAPTKVMPTVAGTFSVYPTTVYQNFGKTFYGVNLGVLYTGMVRPELLSGTSRDCVDGSPDRTALTGAWRVCPRLRVQGHLDVGNRIRGTNGVRSGGDRF